MNYADGLIFFFFFLGGFLMITKYLNEKFTCIVAIVIVTLVMASVACFIFHLHLCK